jgi:hypothetical protein
VLTAQQPGATESAFRCEDEPQCLVGRVSAGQARTCVTLPGSPRHTASTPLVGGEDTGDEAYRPALLQRGLISTAPQPRAV